MRSLGFSSVRRGWRMVASFALIAGLAVALQLVAGDQSNWTAPPEAKNQKNPVPVNDQTLAAGKQVYTAKCANCHGDKGDGKGDDAMMYDPSPADFTTEAVKDETDGELFWKITQGKKPMPSFKNRLSEEQRWQVVNYIRTFAKAAEKPAEKK